MWIKKKLKLNCISILDTGNTKYKGKTYYFVVDRCSNIYIESIDKKTHAHIIIHRQVLPASLTLLFFIKYISLLSKTWSFAKANFVFILISLISRLRRPEGTVVEAAFMPSSEHKSVCWFGYIPTSHWMVIKLLSANRKPYILAYMTVGDSLENGSRSSLAWVHLFWDLPQSHSSTWFSPTLLIVPLNAIHFFGTTEYVCAKHKIISHNKNDAGRLRQLRV